MKKETKVISATVLIVFLMFIFGNKTEEIKKVPVENARRTTVYSSVYSTGIIEEKDKNYVSIDKNGVTTSVNFKVGDSVLKGDTIMSIKTVDFVPDIDKNMLLSMITETQDVKMETNDNSEIVILSNINGVISKIPSGENQTIIASVPFLAISENEDYVAKLTVNERNIKDIEIGQNVTLSGVSFDGQIQGQVASITPYANANLNFLDSSSSVSIDVFVDITNQVSIIKGCTVDAKITVDKHSNTIVIPFSAVFQEDGKEYVYIYDNGYARKEYVTTGYELDNDIEIVSGVLDDDIVILTKDVFDGERVLNE